MRTLALLASCSVLVGSLGSAAALGAEREAQTPSSIEPAALRASLAHSVGLVQRDGAWLGGGADYRARFDERGLRFEPALGRVVERTQHLALELESIERGGFAVELGARAQPRTRGERGLAYARAAGIEERHDLTPAGVELSLAFERELGMAGDLVVRMKLDTSLPLPELGDALTLRFARPESGGVSIGAVTGVDAHGARAQGSLRLVPGALELVLPAHFVDAASWPLVLDPLIGTDFPVTTFVNDDTRPDAAYDADTDLYLVVWQRVFSSTDSDVRGQHVNASSGALEAGTIFFPTTDLCENPCVANLSSIDRFVVAWQRAWPAVNGTQYELRMTTLAAGSVQTGSSIPVIGSGAPFLGPELAASGEHESGDARFLLVYDFADAGTIEAIPIATGGGQSFSFKPRVTIASDEPLVSVRAPHISSPAGPDGRLLVVYERSTVFASSAIRGRAIDLDGNLLGASVSIAAESGVALEHPAVDGYDGRWVVAWERNPDSGATHVGLCAVKYDEDLGVLAAGPAVDATPDAIFTSATRPAVGFSAAKSYVAWRETNAITGTASYRMRGFDSHGCVPCEAQFTLDSESLLDDEQWVALATPSSGGVPDADRGLAVWTIGAGASNRDLRAQLFQNAGAGGVLLGLGGGCGSGGTPTFEGNQAPSIGASAYTFGLTGLPSDALLSVLNVSAGGAPLNCGPCVWNPLQITGTSLVVGGQASQTRFIPCDPELVGLTFQTQWTTLTPSSSACSLFPGFSISPRTRVTIGS